MSAALPFAVLVSVLALGAVMRATPERATLFGLEGPACPSTYLLGSLGLPGDIGCPGCGLTRGTALLLDGQFDAATHLQPAAWLVVLFAACGAAVHGAVLATGRKSEWTERLLRSGRVAFLAGLLAVWLARLV